MTVAAPKAIRVNKSTGTGLEIDWADGHRSAYTFQFLRNACPCATCNDEREADGRNPGDPPKPKTALPMFREPAGPNDVNRVGKYAISFVWNDGHQTGIYTWEYLRELCRCHDCSTTKQSA